MDIFLQFFIHLDKVINILILNKFVDFAASERLSKRKI
jgi:hypothetical protein